MKVYVSGLVLAFFSSMAIGCGSSEGPTKQVASSVPESAAHKPLREQSKLLLSEEPKQALGVIALRKEAKDGDEVVIEGRVGGAVDPWVEGRAAFQIVDRALVPCSERAGDSCPTPWDYCCDSDTLPTSKATIKFVDAQGKTIGTDARKLLGLKELQTVVVKGQAKRDEAGNLTVLAQALYVKPTQAAGEKSK